MSDGKPQHPKASATPQTIEKILARVAPMDNLHQFLIDDFTADEQDEFYTVLEQA